VPFYLANLLTVMGDRFEDPLASMQRLFADKLPLGTGAVEVDEQGLVRMDDRELTAEVQDELQRRFDQLRPGDPFDVALYQRFMDEYAQTRGFGQAGVDYEAEFDTDAVCRA
jgi:enoyl-[acyl-carrier protein] reductase/trans-2-enoyl-CoA reductase (NAD+)